MRIDLCSGWFNNFILQTGYDSEESDADADDDDLDDHLSASDSSTDEQCDDDQKHEVDAASTHTRQDGQQNVVGKVAASEASAASRLPTRAVLKDQRVTAPYAIFEHYAAASQMTSNQHMNATSALKRAIDAATGNVNRQSTAVMRAQRPIDHDETSFIYVSSKVQPHLFVDSMHISLQCM
jgi:hypothetical protein